MATKVCEKNSNIDEDDSCDLINPSEDDILNNLKIRYERGQIYTKFARVLIAINPYECLESLYSNDSIEKYKHSNVQPPHIYSIGNDIIRSLKNEKNSKIVIFNGESGAGKTENTKHLLNFIYKCIENGKSDQQMMAMESVLEFFGNASTHMNLNSSRFSKFLQLFDSESKLTPKISSYFLEKSRICTQNEGETNFHVFYALLNAPIEIKNAVFMDSSEKFKYLSSTIQNFNDYRQLDSALCNIGFSSETKMNIYRLCGAILHLGNIDIEENIHDNCFITEISLVSLQRAANLLSSNDIVLKNVLLTRQININGLQEIIPLNRTQFYKTRNTLAREIYGIIFGKLLSAFNYQHDHNTIPYIGIIDMAGFEFYKNKRNCFEQLCINYVNERFHQLFVRNMVKDEQEWYKKENLDFVAIPFFDNIHIVQLFENNNGILALLDDESKLKNSSLENFAHNLHMHCRTNAAFSTFTSTHYTHDCFIIKHYVHDVQYSTELFIEKNIEMVTPAVNDILKHVGEKIGYCRSRLGRSRSLCMNLKKELDILITELEKHENIFIRCVKPNNNSKKSSFDSHVVLKQLKSASMFQYHNLEQTGFPNCTNYKNLLAKYGISLVDLTANLKEKLEVLMHSIGLKKIDFKIGSTNIFFRPLKNDQFNKIINPNPENVVIATTAFEKHNAVIVRWKKLTKTLLTKPKAKPQENCHIYQDEKKDCVMTQNVMTLVEMIENKNFIGCSSFRGFKVEDVTTGKEILSQLAKVSQPTRTEEKTRVRTETEKRPADRIRYDQTNHLPEMDKNTQATRCKNEGCKGKTHVQCLKCKVHLCLTSDRNCFKEFHVLE